MLHDLKETENVPLLSNPWRAKLLYSLSNNEENDAVLFHYLQILMSINEN